jgi:Putative rhamnosyl transferase
MGDKTINKPMDELAPHILVYTRFGLRVRDPAWLAHRLALISSITAPSLLAQHDQNFCWAVLIDEGLPDTVKTELEYVLAPFGERAFLYQQSIHTPRTHLELARDCEISDGDSYLLTGRIDDDDAWSTTMVGEVRRRIALWLSQPNHAPGLSLTFQDGLEWIMYPMLDVEKLLGSGKRVLHEAGVRQYRMPFIGMSVFVCSQLSDGGTAMAGSHSRIAEGLSKTKGFAIETVSTDVPMWLCCRHKQVGSGIDKAQGPSIGLTIPELAGQFGLDELKVQNYLDHADEHQYTLVKTPITTKYELGRELIQIDQEIKTQAVTPKRLLELQQKKKELTTRFTQLEVDVLGDPETLLRGEPGKDEK